MIPAGAYRTRFAPSPSGLLHLGHAHSALVAWGAAGEDPGRFVLRIEDIDASRCRPAFEQALKEDLAWLGLRWSEPTVRQSERLDHYRAALTRLQSLDTVYPCFCTRRDILEEVERSANAPHGPDGLLYPGTCRTLPATERSRRLHAGVPHAWRLDAQAAAARTGPLQWRDQLRGTMTADPGLLGDVVIARKDIGTSYHLAVVVDDAAQGIELVTRGEDLLHATHVHRLLQCLLQLPVPQWRHHQLITDADGKRLAKRADARAIRAYRDAGLSAAEVRHLARQGEGTTLQN